MHVMGSVSPADQSDGLAAAASPPGPTPPPPPPPPLPPPPPPMPPLLPGLGDPAVGLKKKRRVRSFFWKTIPEEQVKGRANLWTQGPVQQQYRIDVQTIEELFGQSERQADAVAPPTRAGKARGSFRETRDEVSILDSKRGMNVGIFLKQFKRPNQTMVEDLRRGNSQVFGAEPLRELLKLLPDTEEVTKLTAFRGDVSKLPLADSFMYLLVQLPSYPLRIESMLLKEEFPAACEAMKRDIRVLRSATKELLCCQELHAVLHLVLQAGNLLNAGGYAGNAVGFKLSSLLSLADTKANKPGMNLLHFVALEAQKKDGKLLEFPLRLSHVQEAARISVETLDAEMQRLTSRTRSVEDSVQRDTELLLQLDDFLQRCAAWLCSLRGWRQQLKKEGGELLDFFCEDRDAFRLDDCFTVFHTFCTRFTQAVKENTEREAKEAARRRRLQELEEQKRHSWAGGEEVGGAFGLRCSSEADVSAAASRQDEAGLLVELLAPRPRPRSPHSPLGRSGSLRRSRNSPSGSPSAAAERELSSFLEMAPADRKALKAASPSPELRSWRAPPTGGVASTQTPERSANHATATHLSRDSESQEAPPTGEPTSDSNQQSDPDDDREGVGVNPDRRAACGRTGSAAAAAAGHMSVVLETCKLVPELKGFDAALHPPARPRDDRTITDGDGDESDGSPKVPKPVGESELQKDKSSDGTVVVWCVTGVCEGDELHQTSVQRSSDAQQTSCASANQTPSENHAANEEAVPEPISSQPVPVCHGEDSPSDPRRRPAEPGPVPEASGLARDASAERKAPANETGGAERSTNEGHDSAPQQSLRSSESKNKVVSSRSAASTGGRTGRTSASRTVGKNVPTAKPRAVGAEPRTKPVRTLTSLEDQGMRRVVPISRTRPATAPWSRRSSIQRTPDPRDQKVPGAPAAEQNQEPQRTPSVRKAALKPRAEPEEKMCRSTLRALSQATGGSASAPPTPSHRASAPSAAPLPGFARSTASSSFRQTHGAPSDSSPKTPASGPSSALSRSGSLRVVASSTPSDLHSTSSSSPVRRSPSIRSSPRPLLRESLAPSKGHRRNDSGSFSDKSAQSRDSSKVGRPSWR